MRHFLPSLLFILIATAAQRATALTCTASGAPLSTTCTAVNGTSLFARIGSCYSPYVSDNFYASPSDCAAETPVVFSRTSMPGQCDALGQQRTCSANATQDAWPLTMGMADVVRVTYPTSTCDATLTNAVVLSAKAGACIPFHPAEAQGIPMSRSIVCSPHAYVTEYIYSGWTCTGPSVSNTTYPLNTCVGGLLFLCPSQYVSAAPSSSSTSSLSALGLALFALFLASRM